MKYIMISLIVLSIFGAVISIYDSYKIEKLYRELADHMFNNKNDKDNEE